MLLISESGFEFLFGDYFFFLIDFREGLASSAASASCFELQAEAVSVPLCDGTSTTLSRVDFFVARSCLSLFCIAALVCVTLLYVRGGHYTTVLSWSCKMFTNCSPAFDKEKAKW